MKKVVYYNKKFKYDFNYFYDLDTNERLKSYIHPYKKLPEQVEYLLQEQQKKQEQQNKMPPPVQPVNTFI